jgi:hypothetical protein
MDQSGTLITDSGILIADSGHSDHASVAKLFAYIGVSVEGPYKADWYRY